MFRLLSHINYYHPRNRQNQKMYVQYPSSLYPTNANKDKPYLSPIIEEIEAENKERADLDSLVVQKK